MTLREDFDVTWSILKHAFSYTGGSKLCNLCLEEKFFIMKSDKQFLLNNRSEIFSACKHQHIRFHITI